MSRDDEHHYTLPEVKHVEPFAHASRSGANGSAPDGEDGDDDQPGIAPEPPAPEDPEDVPDLEGEPEPGDEPATAGDAR